MLSMIVVSSASLSGGIKMVICRPMASAAVYQKIRSAPRFKVVMMPSSVLLIMASSEFSTIEARIAAGAHRVVHQRQRLGAAGRPADVRPGGRQVGVDDRAVRGIVVDDEDLDAHGQPGDRTACGRDARSG